MKNFNYLSLSAQQLLVFITLHELGTVTATAEKLDITQSAVSHSLKKMRQIFSDDLFVRAGRSIAPTVRSKELYPEIKAMIQTLNKLTQVQAFMPVTATIDYKIATSDYQGSLLFPKLYSKVHKQVSSLALTIAPSKRSITELLRSNEVDLVISLGFPNHADIMASRLFTDINHCFYDGDVREAPQVLDDLKRSYFVDLTFTKGVSLTGSYNQVLEILDKNTIIRVDNFSTIPNFIQGTELLAVMPSELSKTLGYSQLAHAPLPYQANNINVYMLWHKRYQEDKKHKWFREQLIEVAEDFQS